MRELTPEECEFIAGGLSKMEKDKDGNFVAMSGPENEPPIVVVGSPPPPPYYPPPPPPVYPPYPPPPSGGGGGGGSGAPMPAPEANDSAEQTVTNAVGRALTSEEQAAIDKLKTTGQQNIDALLARLGPNGTITVDGKTMTVSELKADWAKTDFVIVDNSASTGNTSAYGSAGSTNYNYGDPVMTIRVGDLIGYMTTDASSNSYVLHEMAHNSQAGRNINGAMYQASSPGGTTATTAESQYNEQWANTAARAIADAAQAPISSNPTGGYLTSGGSSYNPG